MSTRRASAGPRSGISGRSATRSSTTWSRSTIAGATRRESRSAAMVEAGWGRIVNVTTKLDTMNRAGTHPYGATKAALEMATEVWAKEVAGLGLTINMIDPLLVPGNRYFE